MATCQLCKKERTEDHKDYSPVQVITNQPLGWYSSETDGEICGDCMTNIIRNQ